MYWDKNLFSKDPVQTQDPNTGCRGEMERRVVRWILMVSHMVEMDHCERQ